MADTQAQWYITKQSEGYCKIVTAAELESNTTSAADTQTRWGPFDSEGEAIARRVGLIRAGKCQPQ